MHRTLYTIGYEGSEIADFLSTLQQCGIEHVIDIRDVPVSRKRGFSKASLTAALSESGIGYSHIKALGDPKPGREAMRRGDFAAFLEIYTDHLETPEGQAALCEAVVTATQSTSVLLCFERSPKECHRTVVAAEMEQVGSFEVRNIGVNAHVCSSKTISTKPNQLAL